MMANNKIRGRKETEYKRGKKLKWVKPKGGDIGGRHYGKAEP